MTTQNHIEITFAHPHNSATRRIRCLAGITAAFAVEQLIKLGFLDKHDHFGTYNLVTDTGRTIAPRQTLESAGIRSGDTIRIDENLSIS